LKVDEWLDFFRKNISKSLFSLSDLVLLTGEERSSLSVQLTRLVKSGIVDRPVRRWYENPFHRPSREELAVMIRYPSYLSMEYALSRHGVLSQNVFSFTLVTTKLPYVYRIGDDVFEYHQVKRSLFRGYLKEGAVLVAELEKALLDLIYVRFVRGRNMKGDALGSLVDDMYLEEFDRERLYRYAEWYDEATRKVLSGFFA